MAFNVLCLEFIECALKSTSAFARNNTFPGTFNVPIKCTLKIHKVSIKCARLKTLNVTLNMHLKLQK